MIDFLLRLDSGLLLRINGMHAPWLDQIMWTLSSKWINLPLALLILWLLKSQFSWKKTGLIFLLTIVVIAFTDIVSTQLFKDFFERLRPSHDPVLHHYLHFYMIRPDNPYLGGRFGFVSSHAANLAALYMFIWPFLRPFKWSLYLLAMYVFLVSYSRMYLGVHFPSDILCGALLGFGIAWLFRRYLFAKLLHQWD